MNYFHSHKVFRLESGQTLEQVKIAYHSYGQMNADKSNVVWVCHPLSANSDVLDWWPSLFGDGKCFDPKEHFIICANFLGSHYGTTGPLSINPKTNEPYFHSFPEFTIRDMVKLHILLADHLNIDKIDTLIGGSMGGHQALEWAVMQADRIKNLCAIACSAVISPWASALNHSQRMAIACDPTWKENDVDAGREGMKVARSMALLSYRNQDAYNKTQSEDLFDKVYPSKPSSYQEHQGNKLSDRFNAYSYWYVSRAMDSQNLGRRRGDLQNVLARIKAKTLIVSIEKDLLFPQDEQEFLADHIKGAQVEMIPSDYGHDGFLIEGAKIGKLIRLENVGV